MEGVGRIEYVESNVKRKLNEDRLIADSSGSTGPCVNFSGELDGLR